MQSRHSSQSRSNRSDCLKSLPLPLLRVTTDHSPSSRLSSRPGGLAVARDGSAAHQDGQRASLPAPSLVATASLILLADSLARSCSKTRSRSLACRPRPLTCRRSPSSARSPRASSYCPLTRRSKGAVSCAVVSHLAGLQLTSHFYHLNNSGKSSVLEVSRPA